MKAPRNHQCVEIKVGDKWHPARYYESHLGCGGEPGYDMAHAKFIAAKHVTEWEDASNLDPLGYDMSVGQGCA